MIAIIAASRLSCSINNSFMALSGHVGRVGRFPSSSSVKWSDHWMEAVTKTSLESIYRALFFVYSLNLV